MFLLNISKTNYIYIGVALLALLLITILILVLRKNKKPKEVIKIISDDVLEQIYLALGDNNIISVNKEQDRLRLVLKDIKAVDANILRKLEIPAALTGKELKILFRDNSEQLLEYLNSKLK